MTDGSVHQPDCGHHACLGSKEVNPRGGVFDNNAFQSMGGDFWSPFLPVVRRPLGRTRNECHRKFFRQLSQQCALETFAAGDLGF
jgi:hypothetical protein